MKRIFLFITLFISIQAFSQTEAPCPKCSYEYMTVIVKEIAPSKLTMYISRSDKGEMMVKDLSSMSLEQFQYSSILGVLHDFSKEGWRVLSSNMTFETEENKKTRLYYLLYKVKE